MSRTVAGGRTTSFEFMRIEARADGIYYVAQPGGRPPVDFKLASESAVGAGVRQPRPRRSPEEGDLPPRSGRQSDGADRRRERRHGVLGGLSVPPAVEQRRQPLRRGEVARELAFGRAAGLPASRRRTRRSRESGGFDRRSRIRPATRTQSVRPSGRGARCLQRVLESAECARAPSGSTPTCSANRRCSCLVVTPARAAMLLTRARPALRTSSPTADVVTRSVSARASRASSACRDAIDPRRVIRTRPPADPRDRVAAGPHSSSRLTARSVSAASGMPTRSDARTRAGTARPSCRRAAAGLHHQRPDVSRPTTKHAG